MDLSTTNREQLKVLDAEYRVETGHKVPQPVVDLFCRTEDREYREITVEGFRPYFMMVYDEFVERTSDVINDRHVLAVEGDLSDFADRSGMMDSDDIESPDEAASLLTRNANDTKVYHKPDTFDALDETKLVKVYTIEPSHVGKIREYWDRTWEADVPFIRRFLISSGIHTGVEVPAGAERVRYENWDGHSQSEGRVTEIEPCDAPAVDPRMLITDIEVRTNGGGVPDPADAANEITAITCYDNYTGEYAGWILESEAWDDEYDSEQFSDIVRDELDIDLDVMEVFDHETQMVEDFHEWVLDRNFDIISGWNSSGFDLPYIIQRSYNISAYSIRDWSNGDGPYNVGDEWPEAHVEGLIDFDMLDAYKKTQYRDLRSYKLEDVAQAELDMGKVKLEDSLDDAWHKQPVEFLKYNVRDVQAVVEIEQESALLDLYDNMRQVTGAQYNTCNHNGPMLDTLFLRKAYEASLALPTNEEVPPEEGNYHGAKVFDVTPGYVKNSIYPDLSSLYPNLFAMLNLGSETIVGDKDDLAQSRYSTDDVYRVPIDNREFKVVPKGESYDNINKDEYKGVITPKGGVREMFDPVYEGMYVLKPDIKESFLTSTIDDLIQLKNEYTGDAYKSVKRVTNCYTPDTSVLTPDGQKNIQDLSEGDSVYSINPDTELVEVKDVTETWAYPDYDGEILRFNTTHTDLSVTPNHNMLTRTQYEEYNGVSGYSFREAREVAESTSAHWQPSDWEFDHSEEIEEIDITNFIDDVSVKDEIMDLSDTVLVSDGSEYSRVPAVYDADNFIELIGWYVTEGSCVENNTGSMCVRITQTDDENREHITSLLSDMGIDYSISAEKSVNISSSVLYDFFTEYCGNGSYEKKLPEFIFDTSKEQKKLLFETMMNGDGTWDSREGRKSGSYTTMSSELRDDMLCLVTELGWNPRYNEGEHGGWRILISNQSNTIRKSNVEYTNSEDGVYCVTVEENNTLLAGRNGKFQFCGQSVYGVAGDSSSGGKGFRLFDRRVAEGITLAGRRTIEHTAEKFTGYIQDNFDPEAKLVAGDTDSCVSSVPNADSFRDVKEWSEEACEYVDKSYDEFVKDEFEMGNDYDTHRLHVELESVASGLFYIEDFDDDSPERVGVKKRYAQHIIWDDDDGWLDLPDADETAYDVLNDPDAKSTLADKSSVTLDDYDDGVLSEYDPHDHIGIKGFEYVRSDTATVTKEAQLHVLTYILLSDNPADRISEYLSDLKDEIYSDGFDVSKLGRPKGISNPLDDYGWKTVEELENDSNYTVTEDDRENGGRYVATPGPSYRGAKYADDHFQWEDISAGSKPVRFYVDNVRGDEYPAAYLYDSYPKDDRPDPLEVERAVDAISVDNPDQIPDQFILDKDKMVDKELRDKIQPILRTIGEDWDGLVGDGRQVGLDAF